MKIYLPIDTHRKTQGFGENLACISRMQKITTKRGSFCPVGYQDFYKSIGMKGHNGEDWACFYKEPIFFPVAATKKGGGFMEWYSVEASDTAGGIGVDVISRESLLIDVLPEEAGPHARALWKAQNRYLRVKFRFWHMDTAWKDRSVMLGEMIGLGDSTGASSGDHIHWGMKFVDAHDLTLDRDNGYYGAVPIDNWLEDKFILDKLKKNHTLTNAQKVYRVAYYFRMPILRKVGKLLE